MKSRVLVIHSDQRLGVEIQTALCDATITTDTAFSSSEAVELFLRYDYSLVLFDTDSDVMEIMQPLRSITSVPILAVCDPKNPKERVAVLLAGASACLTKPIDMEECIAQVRALLNLYFDAGKKRLLRTIAFGTDFVIDPSFRMVFLKGRQIELTRKEFDLLFYLTSNNRQVFSRQQLYEQVWGYDSFYSVDETVKSCIKRLRHKLGPFGRRYIQTIYSVGYRFNAEDVYCKGKFQNP